MNTTIRQQTSLLMTLLAGALLACCSCGFEGGIQDFLLNNAAPLGGEQAGRRGNLSVRFDNRTPYQAVFTYGTYDPLYENLERDAGFPVKFRQFYIGGSTAASLAPFSETGEFTFTVISANDPGGCGRVLDIGTETLIQRIENDPDDRIEQAEPTALRPVCLDTEEGAIAGVGFYAEVSEGPAEDACESADELKAWAAGVSYQVGVDYSCDDPLLVTFVLDEEAAGGVRVYLSVYEEEEEE